MIDPLQDFNFMHLFYFWVVARDGSISAACRQLHLTQPTISTQIRQLEKSLGHRLFERVGRHLELTDVGRKVYEYAEDMFSIGRELIGALRGDPNGKPAKLQVGTPMVMPKLIVYRLLEPVLKLPEPIHMVCQEAPLDELVTDLARHRYDVILSDAPVAFPKQIRSFNHLLGECTVAVCGTPALAARYRRDFPQSLTGAPLLLPSLETEMRRGIDRWLDDEEIVPRVVGEFNDSALMKEFGQAGAGLFPIPATVLPEVQRQSDLEVVGHLPGVRLKFYAITAQRKLIHPAVQVIVENARRALLAQRPLAIHSAARAARPLGKRHMQNL